MGWCSGTDIFDPIVTKVMQLDITDEKKKDIVEELIVCLQEQDWDCETDSDWWDHPLVRECFKNTNPKWDWESIESEDWK